MRVTVIGGGKMGLPIACRIADRGAMVSVSDIRPDVVAAINAGRSPIDEPGVPELLAQHVPSGRLSATTDTTRAVSESDVVVVLVPVLLIGQEADLSVIEQVTADIARGLRPATLVVYETTVPVGTTRRLGRVLEGTALEAGRDFNLAYSPERVKSQLVLARLSITPKVVGGICERSLERCAEFYETYFGAPIAKVGSLETAEFVKLAGMVYRDVNIALANELARYAELASVDYAVAAAAANTDVEAALLTPGIGVGGHCTPVYPYFLIQDAQRRKLPLSLPQMARSINDSQVVHLLDRLEREWRPLSGQTALVLGLGFRPNVKEHTCSTAFLLDRELKRRGATVRIDDPLYSDGEIRAHGLEPGSLRSTEYTLLILNTAHDGYDRLDFAELRRRGVAAVIDGRNLWSPSAVQATGLTYVGVGVPGPTDTRLPLLPITRPLVGVAEAIATQRVLASEWITQGPEVAAFEREFAEYVGAPHAVAVSNCTTALHLALLAVGVGRDDEVITVSHSFVATANAIIHAGAVPVFVDVEEGTSNIDPVLIDAAITPRTKAILAVHQLGLPCDLARIVEIGRRHGIAVIEDAACAIGSEILWNGHWERIGKPHGDIACFSFHPRKVISTGDGGMLTTANPEHARRFRLWRQHSMSVPDTLRHGASQVVFESYLDVGFNYRMTDLQAAVGREQLKRLGDILTARRDAAARYTELLGGISGLGLPAPPSWARSNWQSYCIRLPGDCDQRTVMQHMLDQGIATRRGVMCTHLEPAYVAFGRSRNGSLLETSERLQSTGVILPLFQHMTDADIRRVCDELSRAVAAARPTSIFVT